MSHIATMREYHNHGAVHGDPQAFIVFDGDERRGPAGRGMVFGTVVVGVSSGCNVSPLLPTIIGVRAGDIVMGPKPLWPHLSYNPDDHASGHAAGCVHITAPPPSFRPGRHPHPACSCAARCPLIVCTRTCACARACVWFWWLCVGKTSGFSASRHGYREGEAQALFHFDKPHATARPPPLAMRLPPGHPALAALPPRTPSPPLHLTVQGRADPRGGVAGAVLSPDHWPAPAGRIAAEARHGSGYKDVGDATATPQSTFVGSPMRAPRGADTATAEATATAPHLVDARPPPVSTGRDGKAHAHPAPSTAVAATAAAATTTAATTAAGRPGFIQGTSITRSIDDSLEWGKPQHHRAATAGPVMTSLGSRQAPPHRRAHHQRRQTVGSGRGGSTAAGDGGGEARRHRHSRQRRRRSSGRARNGAQRRRSSGDGGGGRGAGDAPVMAMFPGSRDTGTPTTPHGQHKRPFAPLGGSVLATFVKAASTLPSEAGKLKLPYSDGSSPLETPFAGTGSGRSGSAGIMGGGGRGVMQRQVSLRMAKPESFRTLPSHASQADSLGATGFVELPAQQSRLKAQRDAAVAAMEKSIQRQATLRRMVGGVSRGDGGIGGGRGGGSGSGSGGGGGGLLLNEAPVVDLPTPSAATVALLEEEAQADPHVLRRVSRHSRSAPAVPTHAQLTRADAVDPFAATAPKNLTESGVVQLCVLDRVVVVVCCWGFAHVHAASRELLSVLLSLCPWGPLMPCVARAPSAFIRFSQVPGEVGRYPISTRAPQRSREAETQAQRSRGPPASVPVQPRCGTGTRRQAQSQSPTPAAKASSAAAKTTTTTAATAASTTRHGHGATRCSWGSHIQGHSPPPLCSCHSGHTCRWRVCVAPTPCGTSSCMQQTSGAFFKRAPAHVLVADLINTAHHSTAHGSATQSRCSKCWWSEQTYVCCGHSCITTRKTR